MTFGWCSVVRDLWKLQNMVDLQRVIWVMSPPLGVFLGGSSNCHISGQNQNMMEEVGPGRWPLSILQTYLILFDPRDLWSWLIWNILKQQWTWFDHRFLVVWVVCCCKRLACLITVCKQKEMGRSSQCFGSQLLRRRYPALGMPRD